MKNVFTIIFSLIRVAETFIVNNDQIVESTPRAIAEEMTLIILCTYKNILKFS